MHRRNDITIKPADKNLGIVILNTDDYVEQCTTHLSSTAYKLVNRFPDSVHKDLQNTVISFKATSNSHSQQLYKYLLPTNNPRLPRFYRLPKIHKALPSNGIPPIHPIV